VSNFKVTIVLVVIVLSALLTGCSTSSVSESKYYLLNNQQPISVGLQPKNINNNTTEQAIVVIVNELPRYLKQANLVMQIDQHQLHYAHHHMWAEPLHTGFSKALLADLNKADSVTIFLSEEMHVQENNSSTLHINIDHFHANNQSKVTLSGQYWLNLSVNTPQKKLPMKQSFYFEADLEKDGYAHSVEKMRALVRKLALEIKSIS